ncbi:MAG: M3 family metallopeptidase [Polyangiaceae bacterium]|nr:M3 family metallopeptidase [Polyangiaceae bacterium]
MQPEPQATSSQQAAPVAAVNPLLEPWTGPFGGVPPFDKVKLEYFQPAIDQSMAMALVEVDRIANQTEPPTFDNTLAAMERATRTFNRVCRVYEVWSTSANTDAFKAIESAIEPKIAGFFDKITQNSKLFARILAVYEARESLAPEQQRLAWKYYNDFVRAGAKLDEKAKTRLSEINQKLAELFTNFSQRVLDDEKNQHIVLSSEEQLAGLPPDFRAAAAQEAKTRGMDGVWVISNTRSSVSPFLTYSDNRELRQRAWTMFVSRGETGKNDTKGIITEILALRAERAKLLGYETHAHWRLEDSMAKTPARALELLEAVWKPATARVREEVADMQAIANKEKTKIKIEPWDYRYYAEKVRKQKYDLDESLLKPYLQLEKLREAMFWVAGELFDLNFTRATGIPINHPDVSVYKVTSKSSGKDVGLFYFDPFARADKRSGAWMSEYRTQERFDKETLPIVSNNSNFLKGNPGEPVLISWDDASTLFHEFGHALHGLSSNVTYPSLAGTEVVRDYVEFPSQILEHWLSTPEVLGKFALHYQTGEPIPNELVAKVEKAATFNQGFGTVEFLASALIDMKLHLAGAQKIDPAAFERDTLAAMGMPKEIVMRHRTTHFQHVFASDGYSAGYYSYLWADVLTADGFGAFTEAGGPYDKQVAERLRKNVLMAGNTVDPETAYRAFRGRDASVDALMRKRGFPVAATAGAKGKK